MTEPLREPLVRALQALVTALREAGVPHMIIGGLAVIARGVVRHTDDADATLWAPDVHIASLLDALARHGIAGRIPDVEAFAQQSQVLLLVHRSSGVPVDLTLAWLPFEQEALSRAETVQVGGIGLPMASAQDLVIYKTIAWRERDRHDVEALLRLHRSKIDIDYVRDRVREFAEAIEEHERVKELDAIIARVDRG